MVRGKKGRKKKSGLMFGIIKEIQHSSEGDTKKIIPGNMISTSAVPQLIITFLGMIFSQECYIYILSLLKYEI